jgi:sporulation protein YlmC with PRC-barrel domain
MKTLSSFGAMLAVLGAAIASTSAQTQSTTVQVSKLVGTKVKSSQGEEIGVIKDVMIDSSTGCMAYTVLSTGEGGARAAGGGKFVAVPWAVYSPTTDVSLLTVRWIENEFIARRCSIMRASMNIRGPITLPMSIATME